MFSFTSQIIKIVCDIEKAFSDASISFKQYCENCDNLPTLSKKE